MELYICPQCSSVVKDKSIHNLSHSIVSKASSYTSVYIADEADLD
jgi:hypothetical protein